MQQRWNQQKDATTNVIFELQKYTAEASLPVGAFFLITRISKVNAF